MTSPLFSLPVLLLCLVLGTTALAAAPGWDAATAEVRERTKTGDHAAALLAGQRALAEGEREFGPDSVRLVPLLTLLGDNHRALNAPASAIRSYQLAAELLSKSGKSVSAEMADTLSSMAAVHLDQDDHEAAAREFAKVIDIRDLLPGAGTTPLAEAFLNLGYCQVRLRNHVVAALFYARALEIERRSTTPDARIQVSALSALGAIERQREHFAESFTWYRQALALQEKLLGPRHLDLAQTLTGMGLLFEDQAKFAEAEAAYLRAVRIAEGAGAEGHPQLHTTLTQLMGFYRERGNDTKAADIAARLDGLAP